jgi:MFS family permease
MGFSSLLHPPRHAPISRTTVALLATAGLLVVGLLAVWIPLGPALQAAYGVSNGATVAAGSLFAASFAVGELGAGPLADRRGRRPVLLIGLLTLAATSLAATVSPTWSGHLAARAAQGLAAGSFAPVALAWCAEALPAPRRMVGLAVLITAYQAAAVVGQLYGQVVEHLLGWRVVYGGLAVGYLVAVLVLTGRLREPPASQSPGPQPRPRGLGGLRGPLGLRPLLAAWLLSAVLWGALLAMYAGMENSGQVQAAALLWIRAAGLAGILTVPFLLAAMRGKRAIELVLLGVVVAMVGLVGQFVGAGPAVLTAGSVLVAAGTTLAISPLTDLVGQLAPAARAAAMSGQSFTLDMGASAAVALSAGLAYSGLNLLLAMAVAVGAMLLVWSVEAANKPKQQPDAARRPPIGRRRG